MRMLFFAHSGLRYLVLLAGLVAVVYFALAVARKAGNERTARILGSSFVGLVDLQSVLGLIMVALGLYYPALLGHLFLMIAAAAVAHVAMAMARSSADAGRANRIRLAGVVVALALIAAGVLSIGRSLFQSGTPTIG